MGNKDQQQQKKKKLSKSFDTQIFTKQTFLIPDMATGQVRGQKLCLKHSVVYFT